MIEQTYQKGRAWIELDMENLRHNVTFLRSQLSSDCELMPAVKANAYGHGAVQIASQLNRFGIQAFCVATVSEGVELRRNGITGLILILGYTHPKQFSLLFDYDLTQSVLDYEYVKILNGYGRRLKVHIAVDTGMHRIGERCENFNHILAMFRMKNIAVTGIYTHLCVDDSEDSTDQNFTRKQASLFHTLLTQLRAVGYSPKAHILSSYGLMNYPEFGGDYARTGIALYGVLSSETDFQRRILPLRPVLSVKAHVTSVRQLHTGEHAGYALAYTAEHDSRIAALSIGYADGLPRSLSCGAGNVLINGCKVPIIGRICMDQTLVDVSSVPYVKAGDVAVIIGALGKETISACEVAQQAGTISNEILSCLSQRLERISLHTKHYHAIFRQHRQWLSPPVKRTRRVR